MFGNIRKYINLFSLYLLLGMSFILFQNATDSGQNKILGNVDGIIRSSEDGLNYVMGWACQKGVVKSIGVHIYLNGSAYAGGTYFLAGVANLPNKDAKIIEDCGNDIPHRFKIKLEDDKLSPYKNKVHTVWVHGLRAQGGTEIKNSALNNSGVFNLPIPGETPGCMHSLVASGKVERSAYPTGFSQTNNDEWMYNAWVWRETGDAATEHSLSIIKTKNLKDYYNLCGEKVELPITIESPVVIDQTVMNGGLHNYIKLGFDEKKQPIVSYQKYEKPESEDLEKAAPTQVYNAQFDGSKFNIFQMTRWNSRDVLKGGGALPHTNHSISFGSVKFVKDHLVQVFAPSDLDKNTSAFPQKATWKLDSSEQNPLFVTNEKATDHDDDDSFYSSTCLSKTCISTLSEADIYDVRDQTNLEFKKQTKMPRFDERWVMLRGDWLGERKHRGGLFDRLNRKFVIHLDDSDKIFYFGPGTVPLWPLVGDWDQDGKDTIGVDTPLLKSSPGSFRSYFKNSLDGGKADNVSYSPKIIDGTRLWHKNSPALNYKLKYEALNSNRDFAYNCKGEPLCTDGKIVDSMGKPLNCKSDPDTFDLNRTLTGGTSFCKDKFLSKLVLWELSNDVWKKSEIDDIWSGSTADIDFMVFKDKLIVAYYDQDRMVKVAIRSRLGGEWKKQQLDSKFEGWDAHNNLVLEIDENHDIHLSGNMHAQKLNYWRSSGLSVNTFKRISPMVKAEDEQQATYPVFSRTPNGKLLFAYRKGKSGEGNWIYNQYDIRTKSWTRFLNTLFDSH